MTVGWLLYQVFVTQGEPRAAGHLEALHRTLTDEAARIADLSTRRRLPQVSTHPQILSAWAARRPQALRLDRTVRPKSARQQRAPASALLT